MILESLGGVALGAAGVLGYGARARSAQLFCPCSWRGPATRRAIALTFDDGPSESTADLLSLLYDYKARATFFQCGHHVRRLPHLALRTRALGHEIGNHTDTHHPLYLRSPQFIHEQIERAQIVISGTVGAAPTLFRPPYGVRWFGLRAALESQKLHCVMWTSIARDWALSAEQVAKRMEPRARPGSILCFHDGRELTHHPDIGSTYGALKLLLPIWADAGIEFVTVSELLGRA